MKKEVQYLSFGASEPHELNRQIVFCKYIAAYLETKFSLYCFVFPEDKHEKVEGVTYILLDQIDHFFEVFEPKMHQDTVVFNHALFYSKIKKFLKTELSAFIYHKLDLEYLLMKKIGLDEADYKLHLKRELYLLEHCDWMYTSSETILEYIQENHGYHQHKCSVIPYVPLSLSTESTVVNEESFYNSGVHFMHIGPVSNRGIRYIKKILAQENNRMTVFTDDLGPMSKQGFVKDDRLKICPFDLDQLLNCMSKIDYGLIRPKSEVLEWIRTQSFLIDYMLQGVTPLLPKEFVSESFAQVELGIKVLENVKFDLPKNDQSVRLKIKNKATEVFGLSELHNNIKFRNLKSLHLGLVNKGLD